jgi:hypothetical protein
MLLLFVLFLILDSGDVDTPATPPKKRAEKGRLMMPISSFGGTKSAKSGERKNLPIGRKKIYNMLT